MPRVLQATPGGVPRFFSFENEQTRTQLVQSKKKRVARILSLAGSPILRAVFAFFATPEPLEALKIHIGQSESRK